MHNQDPIYKSSITEEQVYAAQSAQVTVASCPSKHLKVDLRGNYFLYDSDKKLLGTFGWTYDAVKAYNALD